jgi:hypothetical protein
LPPYEAEAFVVRLLAGNEAIRKDDASLTDRAKACAEDRQRLSTLVLEHSKWFEDNEVMTCSNMGCVPRCAPSMPKGAGSGFVM